MIAMKRGLVLMLAAGILAAALLAAPETASAQSSPSGVSDPANLTARSGATAGSVDLSWTPSRGAQYHFIAYIPSGVTDLNAAAIEPVAAVGSATITGLDPGTEYLFGVIGGRWEWNPADFGAKWSSWSNLVTATAAPGTAAVAPASQTTSGPVGNPTGLAGEPGPGTGTVGLIWTPSTNAQYHFVAYIPAGSTDLNSAQILPVGLVGSATITGLDPGTEYLFGVIGGRWEWNPADFGGKWSSWSSLKTVRASGTAFVGTPETDRVALIELYNAAGGANWTDNSGWLSDAPMGEWYGVTTDKDGRVVGIALDRNGLTGNLPAELGGLTNLTSLALWSNQLTGTIPPELWGLIQLQYVDLGGNRLSGELPPQLGNLSNMEHLELWSNQLTGPIPPELGKLRKLRILYMPDNRLSGEIPSELSNLTELSILGFARNDLTGNIPSWLGDLPKLTRLELAGNDLTGCIPASLRDVPDNDFDNLGLPFCGAVPTGSVETDREALVELYNATGGPNWTNRTGWLSSAPMGEWHGVTTDGKGRVVRIDLGRNELNGQLPDEVGNLAELTYLALWGNDLSGPVPSSLRRLSHLRGLDVGGNQLTGSLPSWLGDLTGLTYLSLWGNKFESSIPPDLGNLANLHTLDIRENRLTERIPPELGNLADLRTLDIRDNQISGSVPVWLGNLTNLTDLRLGDNRLSGEIPVSLANLTNLERLTLYGEQHQLTGCIPAGLQHVSGHDLLGLFLPVCGSSSEPTSTETRRFRDDEVPYLMWEVGPGVPAWHYDVFRDGIVNMHRYASALSLPQLPDDATFYLYRDLELVAKAQARLEGRSLEDARQRVAAADWTGLAGLHQDNEDSGWILVHMAAMAKSHRPPWRYSHTAAHELSHVYQYTLQNHGRFDTTHSEVRVIGPAWMQEGFANFHAMSAVARAGIRSYELRRQDYINQAHRVDVTLKETETYDGLRAGPGRYDMAALAAELLAAKSSEAALIEFWTLLEPGTTWQQAFETAFGMTIDEFYPLFERHRANGFPTLDLGYSK